MFFPIPRIAFFGGLCYFLTVKNILSSLNPAQAEAVRAKDGPVLVLAGAGSGKTKVLASRIAYLVLEMGIDPSAIAAVTFTNKAAGEMRARLKCMIGGPAEGLLLGTFHSVGLRILMREAEMAGYKRGMTVYSADDQLSLVKKAMHELKINEKVHSPKVVLARIEQAKNNATGPEEYCGEYGSDFLSQRVSGIYSLYQRLLREMNSVDFGDLISLPVMLFRKNPALLERYQSNTRYILVDEYQDTNRAQYLFASLLAGSRQNIFAVGDPDQSIYSWRGADVGNILDFKKDFPDALVLKLEQNYRSTKVILDAANSVIGNNRGRMEKTLWTDRAGGALIRYDEAEDERDEARLIIKSIKARMPEARGLKYSDIAVFYRTNAQSRVFEEELMRHGLPYAIVGGVRFYDRKEIRDALAYLRVIANPDDAISLLRVINTPARGAGDATIEKIEVLSKERGISFFEALRRGVNEGLIARPKLKAFADSIDGFMKNQGSIALNELLLRLLEDSGYMSMLYDEGDEGLDRVENIFELVKAVKDFEKTNEGAVLTDFLNHVSLISDVDSYEQGIERITLMTMHSAKGLEFRVVFISGMEEGLFPHSRSLDDENALEEERRLCYVGMTRAMEALFLSSARTRGVFGETRQNMRSRFVSEIPEGLVEFRGACVSREKTVYEAIDAHYEKEDIVYEYDDADAFALRRGMRVMHPSFGIGIIKDLSGPSGDMKATVDFASSGRKKLALRYTSLAPVS